MYRGLFENRHYFINNPLKFGFKMQGLETGERF